MKLSRISRACQVLPIVIALWSAAACAQGDEADNDEIGSHIAGSISLGEGLTAPNPAWVHVTRVPEGITFLDLACTPYSGYGAFSHPTPVWHPVVRLDERLMLPTEYNYGGPTEEPRVRIFGILSPDNDALRARHGDTPIIHGTIYGTSKFVDLVPCDRNQDAGTPCYLGFLPGTHVILDHVFDGCP